MDGRTETLLLAALIVFAGYTVFGVTGFGASPITVPVLAHVLPLPFVLSLAAALADGRSQRGTARRCVRHRGTLHRPRPVARDRDASSRRVGGRLDREPGAHSRGAGEGRAYRRRGAPLQRRVADRPGPLTPGSYARRAPIRRRRGPRADVRGLKAHEATVSTTRNRP